MKVWFLFPEAAAADGSWGQGRGVTCAAGEMWRQRRAQKVVTVGGEVSVLVSPAKRNLKNFQFQDWLSVSEITQLYFYLKKR